MTDQAQSRARPIYVDNYFSDFSVGDLRLALLSSGVRYDEPRKLRYLELGFGTGLALNVHAASRPGEYWGNDYVQEHVDHAAELASFAGSDAHLLADSFVSLAARTDLPQFDVIAAHGIWTWVGDEDRAAIVEMVKRHLKPGGIFYVSYNNTSGWADAIYLRQIMNLYVREATQQDVPLSARIPDAIEFARSLMRAGANYFRINPASVQRLQLMDQEDRTYLQHEFFMDNWRLSSFSEVAAELSSAGLEFAASSELVTHNDQETMTPDAARILESITSPLLRESVRECIIGWGFRQDIFIKGPPQRISADERRELLRKQLFMLSVPLFRIRTKAKSPRGEVDLVGRGCMPILEKLATNNYAPKTIAQLEADFPEMPIDDLIRRVLLLTGAALVRPVQDPDLQKQVRDRCGRLNKMIAENAPFDDELLVLASPVLGAGLWIGRFDKMFCVAMAAGKTSVDEMTDFVWNKIDPARYKFDKNHVREMARTFATYRVPTLEALGIT
jgi:SAM-dependent methyltransferase